MLHLISSSVSTQLHSFPDLATLHTHPHPDNARHNLHHAPDTNLCVTSAAGAGFEVLRRTVRVGQGAQLQRVKKVLATEATSAALSWGRSPQLAIGQSGGSVRFWDFKQSAFAAKKLRPESPRCGAVTALAYSSCNELLGTVYESGEIGVYGLKTHVRMDSFALDKDSILMRFHPTRRYCAAVCTEDGSVYVLDIAAKRPTYRERRAHSNPCHDVCWSPSDPNLLVSAGYDCRLCVYDVRQRLVAQQIQQPLAPFSCCTLAAGGAGGGAAVLLAAGSLKGQLFAYDLRSARAELATRKAYANQVERVAFGVDAKPTTGTAGTEQSISGSSGGGNASNASMFNSTAAAAEPVPNILGGAGNRLSAGFYRGQSIEPVGRGRPSLAAVTGGSSEAEADADGESSFNAWLNKNARARDSLAGASTTGGAAVFGVGGGRPTASRRDSWMDMEVKPARFADVSDSDLSVAGSRRASLASSTSASATLDTTPPKDFRGLVAGAPSVAAAAEKRRSVGGGGRMRATGFGEQQVIMESIDDDGPDDENFVDADTSVPLLPPVDHPNVTSRSKAAAAATAAGSWVQQRKVLGDRSAAPNVQPFFDSPSMMSTMLMESAASMTTTTAHDEHDRFVDKENLHRHPIEPLAEQRSVQFSTPLAAPSNSHDQHVNDTTAAAAATAHLERLIDSRMATHADRMQRHLAAEMAAVAGAVRDVTERIDSMHLAVMMQLWATQDTYLERVQAGVAETLQTVQQLAVGSRFVQEFAALKQENVALRRELAKAKGEPAPGRLM